MAGKPVINTSKTLRGDAPIDPPAPAVAAALSSEELRTLTKEELIELLAGEQTKAALLQGELDQVRATSDAAALMTSNVVEVFAGTKSVKVEVEKGVFEEQEKDFWHYTLDLPPSAGLGISINGMPCYHGQTMTVDTDMLRTVKDMVFRAWYHEHSIFGKANDNAFRQGYMGTGRGLGATLSGKGYAQSRA